MRRDIVKTIREWAEYLFNKIHFDSQPELKKKKLSSDVIMYTRIKLSIREYKKSV